MHDALTIGIPTFAVLLASLLGRRDLSELRAEMNRRFDEVSRRFEGVDKRLDRIEDDLKQFTM